MRGNLSQFPSWEFRPGTAAAADLWEELLEKRSQILVFPAPGKEEPTPNPPRGKIGNEAWSWEYSGFPGNTQGFFSGNIQVFS